MQDSGVHRGRLKIGVLYRTGLLCTENLPHRPSTKRPPTLFGKTVAPYSIATTLCFLMATARKDLKLAFKQANFQFPADVQAPRACRVLNNGDFELFLVSIGC